MCKSLYSISQKVDLLSGDCFIYLSGRLDGKGYQRDANVDYSGGSDGDMALHRSHDPARECRQSGRGKIAILLTDISRSF